MADANFFLTPAGIFVIFICSVFAFIICIAVLVFCCIWANEGLEGFQRMIRRRRIKREQRKNDRRRLVRQIPESTPQVVIARPSRVFRPAPSLRDDPRRYAESQTTVTRSSPSQSGEARRKLKRTRNWANQTSYVHTLTEESLQALSESTDSVSPPIYQPSTRDMV